MIAYMHVGGLDWWGGGDGPQILCQIKKSCVLMSHAKFKERMLAW